MDKISTKNKNFKYALVIIDIYSRYLWVIPIKTKTATATLDGFKKIGKKHYPKNITSDSGSEWKGVFAKYLVSNKIKHKEVEIGDHRSLGIVDRVIRTIRDKLRLLWEINDNFDWISHIDKLVKEYNNKKHNTTKAKPIDILEGKKTNKQRITRSNLIQAFSVNDRVRKLLTRSRFGKGGKQWSKSIYTIKGREGFKLVLNDGTKNSPRELLKTEFKNESKTDTKTKLDKLTKEKTRKQLLKKELGLSSKQVSEIDNGVSTRPKRIRKKKKIFDL